MYGEIGLEMCWALISARFGFRLSQVKHRLVIKPYFLYSIHDWLEKLTLLSQPIRGK